MESGDLIEVSHLKHPKFNWKFLVEIQQVQKDKPTQNPSENSDRNGICTGLNAAEGAQKLSFDNCIVSFALPDRPYHKLAFMNDHQCSNPTNSIIYSNSNIYKKQSFLSINRASLRDVKHMDVFRISSATVKCGSGRSDSKYLSCTENGELIAKCLDKRNEMNSSIGDRAEVEHSGIASIDESCLFKIVFINKDSLNSGSISDGSSSSFKSLLQDYELNRMLTEGFLHIPDVVSPAALFKVDHQLTRHLGTPNALIPGGTQPGSGKFDGKIIQGVEELLFSGRQIRIKKSLHGKSGSNDSMSDINSLESSYESSGKIETVSAMDYAEYLMGGSGSCDKRSLRAQIAFRFPEPVPPHIASTERYIKHHNRSESSRLFEGVDPANRLDNTGTVDGPAEDFGSSYHDASRRANRFIGKDGSDVEIDWHIDDERQGKQHNFTLLLGVCLSSTVGDFEGNLCLWPSSHLLIAQCRIGVLGLIDRDKLKRLVRDDYSSLGRMNDKLGSVSGTNSNLENEEDDKVHFNKKVKEGEKPNHEYISFGCAPLQVTMQAGDIVILHPMLAHNGGPNYSCGIRKMIYFRLRYNADFKLSDLSHHSCDINSVGGGIDDEEQSISSINLSLSRCSSWEEIVEAQKNDIWFDLPRLKYQVEKLKTMVSVI